MPKPVWKKLDIFIDSRWVSDRDPYGSYQSAERYPDWPNPDDPVVEPEPEPETPMCKDWINARRCRRVYQEGGCPYIHDCNLRDAAFARIRAAKERKEEAARQVQRDLEEAERKRQKEEDDAMFADYRAHCLAAEKRLFAAMAETKKNKAATAARAKAREEAAAAIKEAAALKILANTNFMDQPQTWADESGEIKVVPELTVREDTKVTQEPTTNPERPTTYTFTSEVDLISLESDVQEPIIPDVELTVQEDQKITQESTTTPERPATPTITSEIELISFESDVQGPTELIGDPQNPAAKSHDSKASEGPPTPPPTSDEDKCHRNNNVNDEMNGASNSQHRTESIDTKVNEEANTTTTPLVAAPNVLSIEQPVGLLASAAPIVAPVTHQTSQPRPVGPNRPVAATFPQCIPGSAPLPEWELVSVESYTHPYYGTVAPLTHKFPAVPLLCPYMEITYDDLCKGVNRMVKFRPSEPRFVDTWVLKEEEKTCDAPTATSIASPQLNSDQPHPHKPESSASSSSAPEDVEQSLSSPHHRLKSLKESIKELYSLNKSPSQVTVPIIAQAPVVPAMSADVPGSSEGSGMSTDIISTTPTEEPIVPFVIKSRTVTYDDLCSGGARFCPEYLKPTGCNAGPLCFSVHNDKLRDVYLAELYCEQQSSCGSLSESAASSPSSKASSVVSDELIDVSIPPEVVEPEESDTNVNDSGETEGDSDSAEVPEDEPVEVEEPYVWPEHQAEIDRQLRLDRMLPPENCGYIFQRPCEEDIELVNKGLERKMAMEDFRNKNYEADEKQRIREYRAAWIRCHVREGQDAPEQSKLYLANKPPITKHFTFRDNYDHTDKGSFTIFQRLPGELRNKIWKLAAGALNEACVVQLKTHATKFGNKTCTSYEFTTNRTPSLFKINHEVRSIAESFYDKFGATSSHPATINIKYNKERLVLRPEDLDQFLKMVKLMSEEDRAKILFLAVPMRDILKCTTDQFTRTIAKFPNLITLSVLISDSRPDHQISECNEVIPRHQKMLEEYYKEEYKGERKPPKVCMLHIDGITAYDWKIHELGLGRERWTLVRDPRSRSPRS